MGRATPPEPRAGRSSGRWIRWALWCVVPVLVLGAVLTYRAFVDYVERDPRFCGQCHPAEPELMLWTRSQHRRIVCQGCHHESQDGALGVLMELVLKGTRPDGSSRAPHTQALVVDSCAGCHLSHDQQWPQIGQSIGHVVHVNRAGESCLRCHGESIHGVRGPGDLCRECHVDRTVAMDGLGDAHCLACHNFLTKDDTLLPARERCEACHRRRGVDAATFPEGAPMSKLLCGECHRPHQNASDTQVPCQKCHGEAPSHGLHAHPDHADCASCHPHHTWDTRQSLCLDCHRAQEKHFPERRCWSCHGFRAEALRPLGEVLGPGRGP